MNQLFKFAAQVDADIERRRLRETLTTIRDDYAFTRNAFLNPVTGSEQLVRDEAQKKVDAMNHVIEALCPST